MPHETGPDMHQLPGQKRQKAQTLQMKCFRLDYTQSKVSRMQPLTLKRVSIGEFDIAAGLILKN